MCSIILIKSFFKKGEICNYCHESLLSLLFNKIFYILLIPEHIQGEVILMKGYYI